MDSPPPAAPPPSSTTDRSRCRRTRNIAPSRVSSPQPIASPRALSLPQTWLLPKLARSSDRQFLPIALRSLEFSLHPSEPRVQLPVRVQLPAPEAQASRLSARSRASASHAMPFVQSLP